MQNTIHGAKYFVITHKVEIFFASCLGNFLKICRSMRVYLSPQETQFRQGDIYAYNNDCNV